MHKHVSYAPPVSLADLAHTVGVPALGQLVAGLPGAQPQAVKHNETWRYLFRSCTLIGYKYSAVVAGEQVPQVHAVARVVRAAVLAAPHPLPSPVVVEHVAPTVLDPPIDYAGASYNQARDWSAQPWSEVWIAHQRSVQHLGSHQVLDPFAWAVAEGLIRG